MSFECKSCGKDVDPAQAKQTYDEFGQAMCKGCTEKYLNGENNVRESEENEATTPTETHETPADCTMEQDDYKITDVAVEPVKHPRKPTRKMDNSDLTKENVRQYLCPTATDQELFMFLQLCEHRKLNPFIKEAYLIKYNNSPATLVVGKDAFTKKAEEHPEFNGFEAGVIVEKDNVVEYRPGQLVRKGEDLIGGWAQVHRKDRLYPYRSEVSIQEYNTGQSSWKKLPMTSHNFKKRSQS